MRLLLLSPTSLRVSLTSVPSGTLQSKGMEAENSRLRKELEEVTFEKNENFKLCYDYAKIMGDMLEKLHAFKLKTTADMCAWHSSYRNQLADEREENLNLRLRIADMQASAARGLEALRKFRRDWEENPEQD